MNASERANGNPFASVLLAHGSGAPNVPRRRLGETSDAKLRGDVGANGERGQLGFTARKVTERTFPATSSRVAPDLSNRLLTSPGAVSMTAEP